MMKDPLHKELTPYEILEVQVTADKKAIEEAFKKSIALGKNIPEAREARNALIKPVERGLVDIFLYNQTFIQQLVPRVVKNDSQLLSRRKEISLAWGNIQKKLFPHFPSTHSLALLWYWWALYREEENIAEATKTTFEKEKNLSEGYSLDNIWPNTIANWIFLINSEDFWLEWVNSGENTKNYLTDSNYIKLLSQKLENHFTGLFHNFIAKYRTIDDSASVRRFQEYELLFSTERRTGKQLFKAGIQLTKGGRKFIICCGRMLLEQMGIIESIQKHFQILIERLPEDVKLKQLAASLSPFANIAVLIDNKKYDEAIKAIQALPSDQQKQKEVLQFLASAYLEKGKQQFSLKLFRDALDSWKEALEIGELRQEIRETVIKECKSKAASLQKSDPETAINLLDKALKIVPSKDLNLILGEILAQEGIGIINEVQRRLEARKKGISQKAIKDIKKGVSYIERAAELGSKHAAENLTPAKNFLAQAESGFLGLDPKISGLIQKSNKEAEAGNWDIAISLLKKAQNIATASDKKAINKLMAQFYNAHAVQKINEAQEKISSAMETHQKHVPEMVNMFLLGKSPLELEEKKTGKKKRKKIKIFLFVLLGIAAVIYILYYKTINNYLKQTGANKIANIIFWIICFAYIFFVIILPWILEGLKKMSDVTSAALRTMPGYSGYNRGPNCWLCKKEASFKYDVPGLGEVLLCYEHTNELKKILEFVPPVDTDSKNLLTSARYDLNKAIELDPNSDVIRKNMKTIEDIRNRFNIL